jgi:hypothetical protein
LLASRIIGIRIVVGHADVVGRNPTGLIGIGFSVGDGIGTQWNVFCGTGFKPTKDEHVSSASITSIGYAGVKRKTWWRPAEATNQAAPTGFFSRSHLPGATLVKSLIVDGRH